MIKFVFTLFCVFGTYLSIGQAILKGKVKDSKTGEGLPGAFIQLNNQTIVSDNAGIFSISLPAGTYKMDISYLSYISLTKEVILAPNSLVELNLELEQEINILQTAVISDSKYSKPIAESSISMEVIKPTLLDHLNSTSVDEVLDKVPGVNMIGDQANIRGGSGYSYGAGSRVLLMINNIPALQADAGFPNWDDIPVENIAQIEIVKGAASAIYGSSAMNGLVHVRTAYAKSEPVTQISSFYSWVMSPKNKSQQWWTSPPVSHGIRLSHAQKFKKLDLVLGGFYNNNKSYNQTSNARYGRLNGSLQYRINDHLSIGSHFNFNKRKSNSFFYWKDGVNAFFRPDSSTLSQSNAFRFHLDPYILYFDNAGNKHSLNTRYYQVKNDVSSGQSNSSAFRYLEYQYQRPWKAIDLVSTIGLVYNQNRTDSELFSDILFKSNNLGLYVQAEKKFHDWLTLSAGYRWENFEIKRPEIFEKDTAIGGLQRDSKSLFRFGLNAHAATATWLRASWGQGFRFPTLAERFIKTTFGATLISANPKLKSESGWTAELGIKQGLKIGAWKGFIDIAGFWSQYDDMMEFVFTGFVRGFQSQNIGNTDIKGYELSIGGLADQGKHKISVIGGYTFISPRFRDFNEADELRSSVDYNILKYRSKHLFKLDIDDTYGKWIIGSGVNYTSKMEAIDAIFEFVINGLKEYRKTHGSYSVVDFRIGRVIGDFTLNLIAKNLLNEEYSSRPAIMESPRNLTFKIDYKL